MTAPGLDSATVTRMEGVALPGYDRDRTEAGIVHLGLGAFARAHIATYLDDTLARDPGPWAMTGVSLRSPGQRDRLVPQDGLYTAIERQDEGMRARIVGAVRDVLVAPENPAAVVGRLAAPQTRIVSLTITEKGYCHDPATGALVASHPDIRHDLENAAAPRTAVGLVTAALQARRLAGQAPFTVLCCDNLPHNGRLLAGLVRDFAALRDDGLAAWIEREVHFPATMVDRIVPATTDADYAAALTLTGLCDRATVTHEPFRQWVVEERFGAAGRPAWERAGVQMVGDVAPYELMKLRLLNGAHSAIAYLGLLAGYETVAETVADGAIAGFVQRLWRDTIAVLAAPPGVDLDAYTVALMQRFANRAIRHRTSQIAMDGSQKLPQRLLETVRARRAAGLPVASLALPVAAWMHHVEARDAQGRPLTLHDPLAGRIRTRLAGAGPAAGERVAALLGLDAVFGADLPADPAFVAAVTAAWQRLHDAGARGAASAFATADAG